MIGVGIGLRVSVELGIGERVVCQGRIWLVIGVWVGVGKGGCLGGSAVWRLPLAQGAILVDLGLNPTSGSRRMEPASPSACVSASLSPSVRTIINK